MAKVCSRCGKKIGFIGYQSKEGLCSPCEQESRKVEQKVQQIKQVKEAEIPTVVEQITSTRTITDEQYVFLDELDPVQRNNAFISLVDRFLADGELDKIEDKILEDLHSRLGLDPIKSTYMEKVVPSFYVASIRDEEKLPEFPRQKLIDKAIIIKKDEIPHACFGSVLSEIRVKTGFRAGSQGVSLRVMKGVSYRVGGTRGHVTRENELVETSRGLLIITNKRLFLHPEGSTKAVSIPLNKILSYNCFDDSIVINKEGREKPYVFKLPVRGESEVIGICLGFLCSGY